MLWLEIINETLVILEMVCKERWRNYLTLVMLYI